MPEVYDALPLDTLTELFALQFCKFVNVAASAICAFDFCLTFSSEVEHVWGTKWGISRVVFTLSRYVGPITSLFACYVDHLDFKRCGITVIALDAMYSASITFAEGILILRTYTMWGCSKNVLFFLLLLAAAFITGAQVTATKFKIILPGDSTSLYQFYPSLCAYGSSRNIAIAYSFLVAYEIILQSMNSWRKFQKYRGLHSVILNTLYWDGIFYMSCIIAVSGANMAIMVSAPVYFIPVLDTAQLVIHSILASRIFFNLREGEKQLRDEVSIGTSIRFQAGTTVDATMPCATPVEASNTSIA